MRRQLAKVGARLQALTILADSMLDHWPGGQERIHAKLESITADVLSIACEVEREEAGEGYSGNCLYGLPCGRLEGGDGCELCALEEENARLRSQLASAKGPQ